ncbi:hypothetical protein STEG23_016214, partial [Scotinomys teguina]
MVTVNVVPSCSVALRNRRLAIDRPHSDTWPRTQCSPSQVLHPAQTASLATLRCDYTHPSILSQDALLPPYASELSCPLRLSWVAQSSKDAPGEQRRAFVGECTAECAARGKATPEIEDESSRNSTGRGLAGNVRTSTSAFKSLRTWLLILEAFHPETRRTKNDLTFSRTATSWLHKISFLSWLHRISFLSCSAVEAMGIHVQQPHIKVPVQQSQHLPTDLRHQLRGEEGMNP